MKQLVLKSLLVIAVSVGIGGGSVAFAEEDDFTFAVQIYECEGSDPVSSIGVSLRLSNSPIEYSSTTDGNGYCTFDDIPVTNPQSVQLQFLLDALPFENCSEGWLFKYVIQGSASDFTLVVDNRKLLGPGIFTYCNPNSNDEWCLWEGDGDTAVFRTDYYDF